jgi:6-phosphogluconolactonase (cycloisomerase 2 family)
MDASTGRLEKRALFEDGSNPSWLALNPSRSYLYVANEVSDFDAAGDGAVTAYAVERTSGRLTRLNTVSSEGAGPAHLSAHPSGKYVFVANYYGGVFAVLPVLSDDRLGAASDVKRDMGAVGPPHAASAPTGSFAISGHAHAHMIEVDPSGKFVLGSDLGTDRIHIWKFNMEAGALEAAGGSEGLAPAGDGPRHFVFHPNGRCLYSLQEEGSNLIVFDYDATAGKLTKKQQLSTLPHEFSGTNYTSEIRISPDGKFLYAANRLHDSIACFSVGRDGTLALMGETWTRGDYPRSFTIDPSGRFLFSCNQWSDAITCFRSPDGRFEIYGAVHACWHSVDHGFSELDWSARESSSLFKRSLAAIPRRDDQTPRSYADQEPPANQA